MVKTIILPAFVIYCNIIRTFKVRILAFCWSLSFSTSPICLRFRFANENVGDGKNDNNLSQCQKVQVYTTHLPMLTATLKGLDRLLSTTESVLVSQCYVSNTKVLHRYVQHLIPQRYQATTIISHSTECKNCGERNRIRNYRVRYHEHSERM